MTTTMRTHGELRVKDVIVIDGIWTRILKLGAIDRDSTRRAECIDILGRRSTITLDGLYTTIN